MSDVGHDVNCLREQAYSLVVRKLEAFEPLELCDTEQTGQL